MGRNLYQQFILSRITTRATLHPQSETRLALTEKQSAFLIAFGVIGEGDVDDEFSLTVDGSTVVDGMCGALGKGMIPAGSPQQELTNKSEVIFKGPVGMVARLVYSLKTVVEELRG